MGVLLQFQIATFLLCEQGEDQSKSSKFIFSALEEALREEAFKGILPSINGFIGFHFYCSPLIVSLCASQGAVMIFQSWKNKQNNVEEMHCKRASCSKWQQSTVSSTLDAPVYGWDVCID